MFSINEGKFEQFVNLFQNHIKECNRAMLSPNSDKLHLAELRDRLLKMSYAIEKILEIFDFDESKRLKKLLYKSYDPIYQLTQLINR